MARAAWAQPIRPLTSLTEWTGTRTIAPLSSSPRRAIDGQARIEAGGRSKEGGQSETRATDAAEFRGRRAGGGDRGWARCLEDSPAHHGSSRPDHRKTGPSSHGADCVTESACI